MTVYIFPHKTYVKKGLASLFVIAPNWEVGEMVGKQVTYPQENGYANSGTFVQWDKLNKKPIITNKCSNLDAFCNYHSA